MMKTKYTPGPWKFERMLIPPKVKDRRCGFVVNGPENNEPLPERVCDLRVPSGLTGFSTGKANAALIAAAPDLVEALMTIATWNPECAPTEPNGMSIVEAIDTAKAALRKAGVS